MGLRTDSERARWVAPLLALLLGVLIGWWVIGWWLWPVTYTNALPQDLRAAERDEYLQMVAESLAASSDISRAQARLADWPPEQLGEDLANLQSRLAAEDPTRASYVQQLGTRLNLAAVQTNATVAAIPPAPAGQPTDPLSPAGQPTEKRSLLQSLCSAALWVGLMLLGILLIVILWRRFRNAEPGTGSDVGSKISDWIAGLRRRPSSDDTFYESDDSALDAAEPVPTAGERTWVPVEPIDDMGGRVAVIEDDEENDELAGAWPPKTFDQGQASSRQSVPPVTSGTGWGSAAPAESQEPWQGLVRLEGFTAVYHAGLAGYDEMFDIHDSQGALIGQCGLGLASPVGRAKDQAAALQIWLWDSSDSVTKTKVLMSDAAYQNTAIRDQLQGEHSAMPVWQGSDLELETYRLLLRATVDRLAFVPNSTIPGVFSEVVLKLTVYEKEH